MSYTAYYGSPTAKRVVDHRQQGSGPTLPSCPLTAWSRWIRSLTGAFRPPLDAKKHLARSQYLPAHKYQGQGHQPIEARRVVGPGPQDQPGGVFALILQDERPAELPADAVVGVLADGSRHQVTRVRIGVEDQCPRRSKDAHGEEDRARRTVEYGVAFLQVLELGDYAIGAGGFPMAHARLLGLLAGEGFEVCVDGLVPPGGVGVPAGPVVAHLHEPRPHLVGTGAQG